MNPRRDVGPELRRSLDRKEDAFRSLIALVLLTAIGGFGILWWLKFPKRVSRVIDARAYAFAEKTGIINGHPYEVDVESSGALLEPGVIMHATPGASCRKIMVIRFKFALKDPKSFENKLVLLKKDRGVMNFIVRPRAVGIEKQCVPGEEEQSVTAKPFWLWEDEIWRDVFPIVKSELEK